MEATIHSSSSFRGDDVELVETQHLTSVPTAAGQAHSSEQSITDHDTGMSSISLNICSRIAP